MKKLTSIALVLAFGLSACTAKKRDQVWSQNQGENAEAISNYDGKLIDVETQGEIASKTSNTSTAVQGKNDLAAKKLGTYELKYVNFTPKNTLLKEAPFKARANTSGKYQILYKVTENYLKVYKVAAADDIAYDEKTYADKDLVPGKLAVPMLGYPIKEFFSPDVQKNDVDENTNKLIEKRATGKATAQLFRYDANGAVLFEALQKTNVFPKELFTGSAKDGSDNDWFYAETTIATAQDKMTEIGSDAAQDQQNKASNRVKFVITENMLKVVNVSIDERLKLSDDVNFATTLIIPIEWKAYKVKTKGLDTDMNESEDNEVHWEQRPYAKLNFDGSKPIRNGFNKDTFRYESYFEENAFSKVTEVELNDDYFSFTVQKHNTNVRIRYSFWRVSSQRQESLAASGGIEYPARNYFEKDMQKFGFFQTRKSTVYNFEIRRQEDIMKNVFISRYHPNREIKFYFTDTTPKCTEQDRKNGTCLRDIARQGIEAWDKAFVEAGTSVRVTIDETDDKKLGDLRYSMINIVDSLVESNLYGFGPSVSNPSTGEIISATTNVHVPSMRSTIADEISNYIRMKKGTLQPNYYFGLPSLQSLGVSVTSSPLVTGYDSAKASQSSLDLIPDALAERLKGIKIPVLNKDTQKLSMKNLDFKKRVQSMKRDKFGREFDLSLSSSNIHAEIESKCPEVKDYVSRLVAEKRSYDNDEKTILISCANKLLAPHFLGTLVHELGHNFGFRHNFRASTDWKNFYTPKQNDGITSRSSSVMEYTAFNENRLTKPGKYDIANLKFGYAGKIELADGKDLALDTKKSIAENLGSKQSQNYFYCTDEDLYTAVDPLCRQFDAGVTPKDIVENYIKEYNTEAATLNQRDDKIYDIYYDDAASERIMSSRIRRYYLPMLAIYGEWRSQVAQFLGVENQYLQNYSVEEYEKEMKRMEQDPKFGPYYKAYRPAADLIFDFTKKMAELPVKSCVVKNASGKIEFVELERLRDQSFFLQSVEIKSCTDPIVTEALKKSNKTLFSELGYFYSNTRFNTSVDSQTREPLDVIGSASDHSLAVIMMTTRVAISKALADRNFAPGILDEPNHREKWTNYVTSRLRDGVDRKVFAGPLAGKLSAQDIESLPKAVAQFKTEKSILELMYFLTRNAVLIPGNSEVNAARSTEFAGYMTSRKEIVDQAVAKVQFANGLSYVVLDKEAKYALELVKGFSAVSALKASAQQSVDMVDVLNRFVVMLEASTEKEPEAEKMTFAQVYAALAALNKLFDEKVAKSDAEKAFGQNLFALLLQANQAAGQAGVQQSIQEILKTLPAELQAKLNARTQLTEEEANTVNEASAEVVGKKPALQYYKAVKAESMFPLRAFLIKGLNALKVNVAAQQKKAQEAQGEYLNNKEDYDAQYQLLMELMQSSPQI